MRLRPAAASLAWATAACSLALCIAALVLLAQASAVSAAERVSLQRTAALPLSILVFAAVGAVIATHRPRNPIGWLFCAIGLTGELQGAAIGYVRYAVFAAPGPLPAVEPIAWLGNIWVVMFGLVPLLFLLFPDGQLPSPRWRPVVWLTPVHMLVGFFVVGLDLGPITTQVPLLTRSGLARVANLCELAGTSRGTEISRRSAPGPRAWGCACVGLAAMSGPSSSGSPMPAWSWLARSWCWT